MNVYVENGRYKDKKSELILLPIIRKVILLGNDDIVGIGMHRAILSTSERRRIISVSLSSALTILDSEFRDMPAHYSPHRPQIQRWRRSTSATSLYLIPLISNNLVERRGSDALVSLECRLRAPLVP